MQLFKELCNSGLSQNITIDDWHNEVKLPSPLESKAYKGNNYYAYYNFCWQLDQYIEQKPRAFLTKERKITYGQMQLDGSITTSWALHWSTINIKEYNLQDFKDYLLDEIAL